MLAPKQENTKHVYYKFTNPKTGKVVLETMPKPHWEELQLDFLRRRQFEFIREIDIADPDHNIEGGDDSVVTVEEDQLECPFCGYVAEDEEDIKKHKQEKHG